MPTLIATDLMERLRAYAGESDDLEQYVNALGEMFAEVEYLAREDADGNPPWSAITDPDVAVTNAALLWLSQMAGVRVPIGLEGDDMRTFIELAESRRRGTSAYMIQVLQATLTGSKEVVFVERYQSPYKLRVVTRTSETPDEPASLAALLAVKPAGIVLVFDVVDGYTWDEVVHVWGSTGSVTWNETVSTLP